MQKSRNSRRQHDLLALGPFSKALFAEGGQEDSLGKDLVGEHFYFSPIGCLSYKNGFIEKRLKYFTETYS